MQNEYNDLLQRAVVLTNHGQTTRVAMNPLLLGSGKPMVTKKSEIVKRSSLQDETSPSDESATNLIDLNSPETDRTDTARSQAGR